MPPSVDEKPVSAAGSAQSPVWSVGHLVSAIGHSLAQSFNPVRVKGEVSGFMRAASGHCYFTLKDGTGQLRCAMFKRAASLLAQLPKDGDTLEVLGKLDLYPARGDLQLIVESVRMDGQGALYERFVALKAKLEAQGLFDLARKRDLPDCPRHVGVVTSLGAAALRDVVTTLERRSAHVAVTIFPASVQGQGAAAELVSALAKASNYIDPQFGACDLVLLVRGGGSIEDLWSFNDEQLAHAVAAMPMPVVSGVGHETDFSITDFVADLRAPTPTAAAEMAVPQTAALLAQVTQLAHELRSAVALQLDRRWQRLDRMGARLTKPVQTLGLQRERLQSLGFALQRGLGRGVDVHRRSQEMAAHRLQQAVKHHLDKKVNWFNQTGAQLQGLNPQAALERGYAWVRRSDGQALASAKDVQTGDALTLFVRDGELDVQVQRAGY
ncbi:exodeoxyribonuclease VII large subunit [Comamonadaceae bacterium M7527]|nr:exodeoxyribonuclease VII large subunit [Comamonadaceae bacterium M7527]